MKRRISLLVAAFIFIAANFVTAQPGAQDSLLQKCRFKCGDEYKICLYRAGESERRKQMCHYDNRRCLAKCKPQASPGE
jgi:hypothetical protein